MLAVPGIPCSAQCCRRHCKLQLISAHLRGQIRLPGLRHYIFITAAGRKIRDDVSAHTSFRRAGGCDWSGRCAGAVKIASAHCRHADSGAAAGRRRRCRPGVHSRRMVATHKRVVTSGCHVCIKQLKVSTAELHGRTGYQPDKTFTALHRQPLQMLCSGKQPAVPQVILPADGNKELLSCMASHSHSYLVLHPAQDRPRLCDRRSQTAAWTEEWEVLYQGKQSFDAQRRHACRHLRC